MKEEYCLKLMNRTWEKGEGKSICASRAFEGLLTWWDKRHYNILLTMEYCHWLCEIIS